MLPPEAMSFTIVLLSPLKISEWPLERISMTAALR
jgi:hypothetical protein